MFGTHMKLPAFSELRDAERGWIELQLKAARGFVSAFSPADAWDPIRLEALDRAFGSWPDGHPSNAEDINGAINAVGIAFGSILVEKQGFKWTIASDEQGTDLAVRALPGEGDVVVFPANFVAKRWDRKERDFLVNGFEEICRYKETLRVEWEDHRRKS
jgi:hypothetical protein